MSGKRRESGKLLDEDGLFQFFDVQPSTSQERLAAPVCENTFRLEPSAVVRRELITSAIKDVLEAALAEKTYNATSMKKAAVDISGKIRKELKKLQLDRYRLVCNVTIGEKCEQDVTAACRYLWSPEFDHFAFYNFENSTLFATAIVFALYKH